MIEHNRLGYNTFGVSPDTMVWLADCGDDSAWFYTRSAAEFWLWTRKEIAQGQAFRLGLHEGEPT